MSENIWQNELTAYIDGELSDADRLALERQLVLDPQLKALELKLRQTVALMKTLPAPQSSPSLRTSVLSRLENDGSAAPRFAWPKLVPFVTLAAAAIALVFLRAPSEEVPSMLVEEDQLAFAQHLDDLEDLDLVGLTSAEDFEVVAQLKDLEVTP